MAQAPSNPGRAEPAAEDPYEWLEEVLGDKALEWVKARNAIVQNRMEGEPSFEKLRSDLLEILDSNARIPFVSKRGEYYYNFWRDKTNERGLWRRTILEEYRKAEPKWEVVLDLDALGKTENENWVWKGASLLRPDYQRALITLSRGGADANITREFDLKTRSFVVDGFELPESKGSVSWIDIDHLFVSTDFGDASMTDSGYPRMAKLWKRGTPIEQAKLVYEGKQEDMSVGAVHDDSPGFERNFVTRNIAFYNDELFLVKDSGELVKIDAPNTASKSVFKQYLLLELREAWTIDSKTYPAGSLLVSDFDRFLRGERAFEVLFEPSSNTALSSVTTTKDHVVINVLEDVKNRLYVLTPSTTESPAAWRREPLVGAPAFGTVNVTAVDSDESNDYFMTSTDYLTPTTLSIGTVGKAPEELKRLPHFFDSVGMQISQHFATSSDGTKVPYFMVAKKDLNLDGKNPTLLYGYGGFEISLQPNYSATVGRAWLTQGGVYVVANIRGGGEYGPRWHQAALKENRLRAYEDFAAVAKDLVARGVTSKQRLGIQGGSNGGLLVGNMITLYPELFEAGVCQVPLLDMKRYNKLLAGASWMAEYGNPDYPDQWAYIRKFSPYQNVQPSVAYPKVLFTTSTRDDRVHPGHARKMMAKMESQGHAVWYYENIEGGHGGAANNKQSAFMQALAYTFLKQELMK
ncbi:MAG: prolyl oligopeptidase family serine peptidase [Planctomycetota bacterium]|nr:prolyl oligopeptidase family serine peptidase [Planctomycetota bacterium]